MRNRRLLRATEVLQGYSVMQSLKEKPAYKLVFWRSATVVMGHRRVCTINDGGSMVAWLPDWYAADLYTKKQDIIEAEINSIKWRQERPTLVSSVGAKGTDIFFWT